MAGPNIAKLSTLPWVAWVSVSVLLHVGVLSYGLPRMLRVGEPASSAVNIPVTLVDEGAAPVTANNPNLPQAQPASEPVPESLPVQPIPIQGNNTTVEPNLSQVPQPVQAPTPQEISTQEIPSQEPQVSTSEPSEPVAETPAPTAESSTPVPNRAESPADQDDRNDAADEVPPVRELPVEGGAQDSAESMNGPVEISILGVSTVPPDTLGDWPEVLPTLESASIVHIPGGHNCGNQLPSGELTLGLIVEDDGTISEAFALPNEDIAAAQIATCLLTRANGLRFTPAYSSGQPIATDRMRLTVQFFAS
ncbi:MAG: hypothetical protein AAGA46_13320 [Cyanobacteria bacterium P01_F01_bin.13]